MENKFENEIIRLTNLLERSLKVADKQKENIEDMIELNRLLNKIIEIKDEIIDKQLQMLQILEIKLKDFGYELKIK
jgi:ABC-type Na+ transport system ATPase subunit NatA